MRNLKSDVLTASKNMFADGLVFRNSGNISAFDRTQGIMTITPSGMEYDIMTENDLVEMKLDGTIISGKNDPSSEWKMHAVLYSQKEDIRAIVHTHSQYATAFAILGMPIPLILIEMVYSLGKCVPLAEFALPGTEDLGHKACKALEEGVSCLLANHGVLAVGDNVSEAYERVHYVEHVADIYHKSLAIGSPNVLSEQMAAQLK